MKVFEVRFPVTASPDEYVTNDARIVELLSRGNCIDITFEKIMCSGMYKFQHGNITSRGEEKRNSRLIKWEWLQINLVSKFRMATHIHIMTR